MLTRVVVVAFVLGMFCCADAKAQATGGAPPTEATASGSAGAGAGAAGATTRPVGAEGAATPPINISATQPLVTTPPSTTRPTNRSAEETLRQMLQPQGESARPLQPIPDAPPAVDATSGDAAVAPGGTP